MNTKKLLVVGFGPGDLKGMTLEAKRAIEGCETIVGFTTYNRILKEIFPDKEYRSTCMGQEEARVRLALDLAVQGKKVCLVCSGDASIYGMAGLVYELSEEYKEVEIETVAGVTAALSGSALLGAAVGNDLCVISLSDYHTSQEEIDKRLEMAAECDFVIALYNPRSKARPDSLKHAVCLLRKILPADRICGIAENIGRDGEEARILLLSELENYEAAMFTTVFIGNSKTKEIKGKMVTPRGYLK